MKAIRIHHNGPPEALSYETVPLPEPGEGEVRIKIEAAGLNFIDIYHRLGNYPSELPFTPGMEGAGVVDAVGPGVTEVKRDDRVTYAMVKGSYTEYAIVPAWRAAPIPDGIGTDEAAAVMLQGTTAHYLAVDTYPLSKKDTALVHAAAGGVGQLLVQMAKTAGARVIGTCSTPEKAALAKAAGADEMILYTEEDFEAKTKELTDGRGVDVVYDSVGQATFLKSLNCLHPRGTMVLFGAASGPVEPINPQILNQKGSLFLTRPSLGHYLAGRAELLARMEEIFGWMTTGKLKVHIDQKFRLSEAAEAHRYMEARQTKGKVLLIP
ncbi:MAG: quinone oxidoreductase [Anaerolineae bacterium]